MTKGSRLCEALRVGIGDRFKVLGDVYYITENGYIRRDKNDEKVEQASVVFDILNSADELVRVPKLTETEMRICKAIGANWVSRDPGHDNVDLWVCKPTWRRSTAGYFEAAEGDTELASIAAALFPSIKPKDCVCITQEECDV